MTAASHTGLPTADCEAVLKLTRDGDRLHVVVEHVTDTPDKAMERAAARVVAFDGVKLEDVPTALQSRNRPL